MIENRDPGDYGITRDDVLARAAQPYTKEGLFSAACTELYARILAELQSEFGAVKLVYDMVCGPAPLNHEAALDAWNYGLVETLGKYVPEMYQHHLAQAFPDLDLAAATIAGWMVNGARHPYVDKPGQFLAKMGLTKLDWDPVAAADAEYYADVVIAHMPSVPATRDEVSAAWLQFGQAINVDQRELAKNLAISRSTVSNYQAGKTAAKCSTDQAAVLAAECRQRALLLVAAAGVFERVK